MDFADGAPGLSPVGGDESAIAPTVEPGLAVAGSIRRLCRISSIGASGAVLHADFPIETGERLELDLDSGDQLRGLVAWRRGTAFGLRFDAELDLLDFVARRIASPDCDRRRMPRIEIGRPSRASFAGQWADVTIREISPGGARIDAPFNLCRGDRLFLEIEGLGELASQVRWTKSPLAGLRFDAGLDWPDLLAWLKRARDDEPKTEIEESRSAETLTGPGCLPVSLMARVREGNRRWEIEIRSLDTRCASFDCYAPIVAGALLWLVLPGLEGWPARVARVEGFRLFCEFLQPLHPAVVERILALAEAGED